jgi:hypothetical protein
MPRFYFHVCNGSGLTPDHDGQTLGDEEEARAVAILGAREMMAGDIKEGELDLSASIKVEDENGDLLFTLVFEDAVNLTHMRKDR